ncbi:uncharacterized protein [Gossypium hirsutum]|uniref:RNase H type-1 domain-containing protein n=1 Tax=Gossypium hirsutum TaxID=3635 RepID=A0A1U8I9P8_GOSHI|nr:uncharacterized protein LOC107892407 [Gossypium hirsutum]
MAPLKPPFPKWYDPNANCMYHTGNQGHSTENCLAFKRRVQGLIDTGVLRFDGVSNVTGNPLPNHTSGNVNAMTNEDNWRAKVYVAEVRTPLRKVKVLDSVERAEEGEICASDNQSTVLPYSVDRPLVIYYEAKKEEVSREVKPSLIIEIPAPFSYKDNKAVPWKYDVNIIVPEGEKSKVMNEDVSEVGHFTRSGRCYSPETVEPKKKVASRSQKGKAPMYEVEDDVETQLEQEVKKAVNEEEAHEFLKFIKHSEYSVVEQLNKQPARISVLSLLLNSEPHRNALLKVLNQAYVANNVSVEKLDRWANNLNADNFISFSDDEIPPNGRGSVKALHITSNCKGYILPNVLIDNGSTLNVMPLATLSRMPVDMSYLRPCYFIVRAFDGTRREVMGKIKIPLKVGPCAYDIEFQVMDITPLYNCLLGRPWIHSAGAVPSSLHQKVKFIMDSRLITVDGEEDIIASISTDAPYIEISEDAVECSFRSLEFINVAFVAEGNKIPIPKLSRGTKMGIKLTVGKGARARKGLGAFKPTHHKGRYDLGFKPDIHQRRKQLQKDRERRIARASGQDLEWEPLAYPPMSRTFTSAGVMYPGQDNPQFTLLIEKDLQNISLNAIDNESDAIKNASMIRPCPPGYVLNNWTAVDLLVVSKSPSDFFHSPFKCSDINGMNNPVMNPKINFEKVVCLGEFEADENVEDCVSSPDLLRMVEQEQKQILPHQESVEVVNLGNEEKKQEVKIGTSISENTRLDLIALLREYKDVFAWSYQDMPGLNTDIVVHKLPLKPECYNQIKMAPEDMEKTTFITMWGTFCYKILLTEYDIVYVSQKSIKGSAIADFLASRTTEEYEPLRFDFPDEDLMCISEKEAEYEACVMGLRAAIERKIKILEVHGDSALVIYQIRGDWEVKD